MTRRLLLSYLGLALLVLLALEIPLGLMYARGESDRFLAGMERDAVALAERAEEAIEEGDTAEVPEMLAEYARDSGAGAVVVDPAGLVLARSDDGPTGANLAGNADIAAALRNQRVSGLRTAADGDVLAVTVPAASGTKIRGALQVTQPATAVTDSTNNVWWVLAGVGLAVLAAAGGAAVGLARWMARPVQELEAATARLASGRLSTPPRVDTGPPEVRRLAATFTHTAGRLQEMIESQRAFAADASHQLKTPLTALRLRLENLEPDVHPSAHASLDAAVGETDRLTTMVQGLLALARLDNAPADRTPVDLDTVIADRADSWAPFAAEHDVTVTVTGHRVGPVSAVPGAIEQVLDNLLANALRVAPPGSTLAIDRRRLGEQVEVHVIDQGPGMNAADRRRAFDRFWRAPDATDDGSGLGLAIVARLVTASGGTITLDQALGTGIDATIRLPAVGRPAPERTRRQISEPDAARHRRAATIA